MSVSSPAADGFPSRCPVCGEEIWIPSVGTKHEFCPHCGRLLRIDDGAVAVGDPARRLTELGAFVEVDDEGEVQAIRFVGAKYNDSVIPQLARLRVPFMDIRETSITPEGLAELERLLPRTTFRY